MDFKRFQFARIIRETLIEVVDQLYNIDKDTLSIEGIKEYMSRFDNILNKIDFQYNDNKIKYILRIFFKTVCDFKNTDREARKNILKLLDVTYIKTLFEMVVIINNYVYNTRTTLDIIGKNELVFFNDDLYDGMYNSVYDILYNKIIFKKLLKQLFSSILMGENDVNSTFQYVIVEINKINTTQNFPKPIWPNLVSKPSLPPTFLQTPITPAPVSSPSIQAIPPNSPPFIPLQKPSPLTSPPYNQTIQIPPLPTFITPPTTKPPDIPIYNNKPSQIPTLLTPIKPTPPTTPISSIQATTNHPPQYNKHNQIPTPLDTLQEVMNDLLINLNKFKILNENSDIPKTINHFENIKFENTYKLLDLSPNILQITKVDLMKEEDLKNLKNFNTLLFMFLMMGIYEYKKKTEITDNNLNSNNLIFKNEKRISENLEILFALFSSLSKLEKLDENFSLRENCIVLFFNIANRLSTSTPKTLKNDKSTVYLLEKENKLDSIKFVLENKFIIVENENKEYTIRFEKEQDYENIKRTAKIKNKK